MRAYSWLFLRAAHATAAAREDSLAIQLSRNACMTSSVVDVHLSAHMQKNVAREFHSNVRISCCIFWCGMHEVRRRFEGASIVTLSLGSLRDSKQHSKRDRENAECFGAYCLQVHSEMNALKTRQDAMTFRQTKSRGARSCAHLRNRFIVDVAARAANLSGRNLRARNAQAVVQTRTTFQIDASCACFAAIA